MQEKRFSLAGFEIGVAADSARAERLKKSLLYRGLLKPGLRLVGARRNGHSLAPASEPPASVRERKFDNPELGEIWQKVQFIGWYHTIDLGNGIVTPGFIDNRETVAKFGIPEDLTGMRCLDIGTYDGFWSFEMERRGASEVIGIDVDSPAEHDIPLPKRRAALEATGGDIEVLTRDWDSRSADYGLQYPGAGFRLAKEVLGSRARREVLNVYDLSPEKVGMFDVVLISQLLLRLRDPQTVLENMFSVCKGMAIVAEPYDKDLESLTRPVSEFIGTEMLGVWWAHSIKSMKKIMETAGFERVEEVSRFPVTNRAGSFDKVILKGYVPQNGSESV
jgi:tRNA (mo5U34)-methyltransferase